MASSSRIRMRDPYGKTPPNVFGDFDWIRQHEKELINTYGERSIIVYREQVIGVGKTYAEALQNAELNLPADSPEITPVHQELRHRHPFLRIHPRRD
jgi:hypothetical protein